MNQKKKHGHKLERKKTPACWHKFNWKYALVNSVGKGLLTGPNKALVDTVVRTRTSLYHLGMRTEKSFNISEKLVEFPTEKGETRPAHPV